MTPDELSQTLPNGFHDAKVMSLRIDYVQREVVIDVIVWVGDDSSNDPEIREIYRSGTLTLSGLLYCAIEPPDPGYPYSRTMPITIDTGNVKTLPKPPSMNLPEELPNGAFTNWIFVNEWNSFIYISAMDANLSWYDVAAQAKP